MACHFTREFALVVIAAAAIGQGSANAQSTKAPDASTGIVYVSRPSVWAASLASVSVNVNGKSAGWIKDSGCIKMTLPVGRYTISGSDWVGFLSSSNSVRVDVRPGSSNYVLITPYMSMPSYTLHYLVKLMPTGRRC